MNLFNVEVMVKRTLTSNYYDYIRLLTTVQVLTAELRR